MKKYLKLQAKKSLSLIMAVLMLMSCWVWIAPEKAEAAETAADGYYHVRVYGSVLEYGSAPKSQEWTVTYKTENGLGSEASTRKVLTNKLNLTSTASNTVIAEAWVPGWPTIGHVSINASSRTDGCDSKSLRIEWTWQVYNNKSGEWEELRAQEVSNFTANWDHELTVATAPTATSFSTLADQSLTIPMVDTGSTASVANLKPTILDQYGVTMTTLSPTSYSVGDSTTARYTQADHGFWVETASGKATIKVNELAQEKIPCSKGNTTTTHYLYAAYSGNGGTIDEKQVAKVTLNYNKYETKIHPQGTLGDANTLSMELVDKSGNKTYTASTWSSNDVYGVELTNWPSGVATKTGYDFHGYWTVKQPSTGNSAITADSFAIPVSSTDFAEKYGGTTGEGTYVTKDGVEYFNAGKQWDPSKGKTVFGKGEYYGWWASKTITAKFYDIDGTYLGTQTTKYGKTEAENWYPDPKDSYNAGAYEYQTFAKQWRDITGAVITEGSYTFGPIESLQLTPIYTTKTYTDKYTVNFVDPANGSNIDGNNEANGIASGKYDYRHVLEGNNIPSIDELPGLLTYDNGYTYEFTGWTTQKPASGNYHTVAKNDTSFVENTDWVVRDNVTYYAVFRSTVKEYVIAFQYTDTTGTVKTDVKYIPYGSAITTPADVNRTYAQGGYGYTLEGWDYTNNSSATVMFGVDDALVFIEENVFLTQENLKGATPEKPIVFKANYDEGQPTPYTVTFKYKDEKGNGKVVTDEVYHGFNITAGTVAKINVPAEYDDGTALYTFSDLWKVTEGTAGKAEYTKDEFTSFSPTSHVTFEAVYGEGVPFYTVTYHANNLVYSERVLKGSNVPAWMIQTGTNEAGEPIKEEYVPEDYDSETGTYEFAGWFDEEQTDKDFAQTNGTEYTTASTVNGDLNLYAQYVFEPFKFTIKFMNYDGTVQLAIAEVEAGQSYEAAFAEAQRAAQYRAPDEKYSYTFIGWDHKVPDNYLCEGKDMTYTAQYQPSYIYYKASWYKAEDAMSDAGLLAITNHTYEGSVYAPSVNLEIPDGKVFAGWYYRDGENEVAYQRGMTITKNMSFYAKYNDAPKSYTITAHIGNETFTYTVAEGKNAEVIGTPVDGYIDETNHNDFIGWYTSDDYAEGTEFDMNAVVTENIEVYAKIEVKAHDKSVKELIAAPTYYANGSEKVWCACSKEDTLETVEIPMLTDKVAPTGTIYLGTQGKWSSTDAIGAAATDNDDVIYFANADTDIILTINDTGDVNDAYNPSGVGKGIANIQGIISTGVFGADTTEIAGIQIIFTDSSETLNNTANYVSRLGDYGLEDGKTYIAYYYAKDKAGNELNRNVRTAKFIYDITAPEFTVEGDCSAITATYCGKAVIKGIENAATVTVNGEEVELTTAGASGATAYTISEAGNYLIKVTDKAGNSTSKKIKVTDGHDEVTTEKAATCLEDGYKKVTCAVCAKVLKNETIKSEGHKYGAVTTVAPTCDEKGYDLQVCSVCGDEKKTNEKPAAGHKHEKDAEGNIVYTVITAATCSTEGKKISNCTVCGKDTKTEIIPTDANAHVYGATKTLKATCDEAGEKYQNCKYCFVKKTVETLPKLEHKDTGRYTKVTTAATCYSEGVETTYCKACDEVMGAAPIAIIAHTLVLVKYEGANNDDVENYPYGYMQYECKATGCTHTEGKTAITVKATYTVTFKGAGENGADLVITKTEGETIAANEVADQTKAKDNEYEYKFAGWKGTDGKVVKLPVKATKNETYTAEFTATKRIYTHIFKINEGDTDAFATVIGAYNAENKKPASVPTKPATATATYKFAGWTDTLGAAVTDFTMTGDATFVAKFDTVPLEFNAIFYNEDGSYIWSTKGNSKVKYDNKVDGELVTPVKAPDAESHYTFAGWKLGNSIIALGAEFGPITEATRIYATYTAAEHNFVVVNDEAKTWAATCTKSGQTTEKCSVCDYEKVTVVPMIDHKYELQADGSKKCSVCGDVIEAGVKEYSITFAEKVTYYDIDGETVVSETKEPIKTTANKTKTYKENADVEAVADDKADTAKYTVEFIGWSVGEDAEIVLTIAELKEKATADVTYVANYKAVWRVYSVSYLDADYSTLQGPVMVKYGDPVPGFVGKTPSMESTDLDHYIHIGWSVEEGAVVKGKLSITPKFDPESHDKYWVDGATSTPATCVNPGTVNKKCSLCGKEVASGATSPATGHKYVEVPGSRVEADYGVEGYVKYECQNDNCPEKIKEERTPALTYKTLTVTVLNAPANAVVELRDGAETVRRQIDDNARAVFEGLKDGKYTIVVEGVEQTVTVNKDTAVEINVNGTSGGDSGSEAPSCSCGCHRPGFWGAVFRFFHKIISWFTGRIGCCECPSPLYK